MAKNTTSSETTTTTELSKIDARVNEMVALGYTGTTIKGVLKAEKFATDEIESANIPSTKKAGLDATAIMTIVIENEDKSNKDILKVLTEADLCEASTAKHIVSLLKFCKAYHAVKIAG